MTFKRIILSVAAALLGVSASAVTYGSDVTISKEVLKDKMLGGWAGQVIGCTYGGPTEFKWAIPIHKYIDISWNPGDVEYRYDRTPYLYDDIYMDLTFVEVFDRKGLDAKVEDFADAFAHAKYHLWHANLQARYNILQGIMPPASGHWENNPHADDIDFQIEADYAGLMAPGMVNAASYYCDDIGHMMNYGDGWYGGVYVAAMYALAFVSDDVEFVVKEALKTIPKGTKFRNAMEDVIGWYEKYPEDWNICWALVNDRHGFDIGCPEGVYREYNIDAVINSAYILIGLLYGQKDYFKTIDISCRCGADSDCNPASAAGILGTMIGYSNIPKYWTDPLIPVIDRPFPFTSTSLNKAAELSFKQGLEVIERNGGKVGESDVTIKVQAPEAVRYEQCFEGHWPVELRNISRKIAAAGTIGFDGNGIVVRHRIDRPKGFNENYVAEVEAYIDDKLVQVVKIPFSGNGIPTETFYTYNLPVSHHELKLVWRNPKDGVGITLLSAIVYSDAPRLSYHGGDQLRVASFNNQCENEYHPWAERADRVTRLFNDMDWDLVGMQEPFWSQMQDMEKALPQYGWVGCSTDGKRENGKYHYNAIFYLKDRLEVLDNGQFWFSKRPSSKGSKSWDSHTSRFCVWARFLDKRSGKEFYCFNAHFDHKGEQARQESAKLLLKKIGEIAGDVPFVVTGDFNTVEDSPAYNILVDGGLKDSWSASPYRIGSLIASWNDWKPASKLEKPGNFDHVFVSEGSDVISWRLITREYDGQTPSDHYPIYIEWKF